MRKCAAQGSIRLSQPAIHSAALGFEGVRSISGTNEACRKDRRCWRSGRYRRLAGGLQRPNIHAHNGLIGDGAPCRACAKTFSPERRPSTRRRHCDRSGIFHAGALTILMAPRLLEVRAIVNLHHTLAFVCGYSQLNATLGGGIETNVYAALTEQHHPKSSLHAVSTS